MKSAFDEVIANGVKRRHEPQRLIGDLLKVELADKAPRSINYQPATGGFLAQQRNIVLAGGTGSGKTHLAVAIARSCIRGGAAAGSSMSSIRSTGSRPRAAMVGRAGLPIT